MASAQIETHRHYILKLSEREAGQLLGLLQNPINGVSDDIRKSIWNALKKPDILPTAINL